MLQKNILTQILKIQKQRHRTFFGRTMPPEQIRELSEKIRNHYNENQLNYAVNDEGKLQYFVISHCSIMPEFNEQFFHVSLFWCEDNALVKRKVRLLIKKLSKAAVKERDVKRMIVSVAANELADIAFYEKKGKLTYIELVGKTEKSLEILQRNHVHTRGFVFSRLTYADLPALVKLDVDSHLNDPSSRMRDIFSTLLGKKLMKNFYRNMVKSGNCLVLKKEGRIAGSAAWFIDRKNKYGLVASIFVAEKFKGMGLSRLIYKKLLQEFKKKKCSYYIGSSTTRRVLDLAVKLKRKPAAFAFILDLS